MTEAIQASASSPKIIQWILDTRPLWPVTKRATTRDEVAELEHVASRALSFLLPAERSAVLRYYRVKDAKMSLASHLLKRLVITKYGGVPWSKSAISRDANGKPKWDTTGLDLKDPVKIGFNVSHQAGLVSLIAVIGGGGDIEVGTDVVCANERSAHDYRHIEKDGFFDWVGIHGDVFAESEVSFMKLGPVELDLEPGVKLMGYGNDVLSRCQWRNQKLEVKIVEGEERSEKVITVDSNVVIDKKLRRFYAMWCLREAYVKMTGEALLAPWLKELEISEVRAPIAKRDIREPFSLEEGEVVKEFRVIVKGRLVTNVQMELSALGTDYMVAGSARSMTAGHEARLEMGKWKLLDLEAEVLAFGQAMD